MDEKKKLIGVDYLRAFCMLYVVGYWHLFNYTDAFPGYANPFTQAISEIVLGLFTTISGFLIGSTVKRTGSAIAFYKKRLIRIYPLYVVAVIIFFAYGINDAETSFKALIFLSMYYAPAPATLWFITMLMLFYVATPFLLRIVDCPKKLFLTIVTVFAVTMLLQVVVESIDIRVLFYFPCYCMGLYCSRHGLRTRFVNAWSAISLILLWFLVSSLDIELPVFDELRDVPMILGFSYLILLGSCVHEDRFKRFLIISALSYSSYAMYLFHRPIYSTLQSMYFPETGPFQALYLMTVGMLIIFFVSWGAQRLYDSAYAKVMREQGAVTG